MSYTTLTGFISALEAAGELVRIKEFVSPNLEITEITDRISKQNGPALLFENNGTEFPLLINAMGSEKRMCMALGVDSLEDIGRDIDEILKAFLSPKQSFMEKMRTLPLLQELASWMPKVKKGRGACQEVVMQSPDLTKLPVLTCWPADGGPFITLPCVHTKDPVKPPNPQKGAYSLPLQGRGWGRGGIRNLGMYRMQLFGPDLTGMHWHLHKGSANHYQKYKEFGMRMPVSVTLGGDPVCTYVATAPLPENLDEYLLAGFLRKKKVELVKCLTNDLEVPADADFVIEGYVDPEEELILEGPFGDHTGFYSLAGYFPKFHVTCITHRKGAVYPATIVGIPPQEDGWIGKATERIFVKPLKMSVVPELTDMHMPVEGVFHNIVLASIEKNYPGQAEKVMNAFWGAGQMMFNKILVITDPDVDLTNYREVARAISDQVDPLQNILFSRGPLDILDHSSTNYASGSKIGIDATKRDTGSSHFTGHSPGPSTEGEGNKALLGGLGAFSAIPNPVTVNDSLLQDGISFVIISFRKNQPAHARKLAAELVAAGVHKDARFIVMVDEQVDPFDLRTVVWLAANNIDPLRDCFFAEKDGEKVIPLFIDATRKSLELDGFMRDWPNVIIMNDETIDKVDRLWPALGLGPNISSPSMRYKPLVFKEGPIS